MAKVLFFFTSTYPFGIGETFIENEIEYLSKAFDKIIIVSNDTISPKTRVVPTNVVLERKGYELNKFQKLVSLTNIFSSLYRKEKETIRKTYHFHCNQAIINTMCQTLQKGRIWHLFISQLIKKHTKNNDKLYLYSYWNNDMAFCIARYKMFNNKVKAFSRMHGWDVYFEANSINYLPFRDYIFSNLDKVFTISEKGKSYYKTWLPKLQANIKVANLGTKYHGKNLLNENNKLNILTVSNTIAIKNIEVLVKALALLKIPFYWTHFGDGELQEDVKKQAEKYIPDKFSLKGRVTNQEIINYLKTIPVDLFVNASLSEGIPVSIMEAMSFGIPCIATAVGGTPEIVNNENGMLLSANPTPEEIAEQIIFFHNLSDIEKEYKRKAAYNTWNEEYNAEKNYSEFIKKINTL